MSCQAYHTDVTPHITDYHTDVTPHITAFMFMFRFMVFNTTFNIISIISWWSVLLVEKPEKTTHLSQITDKLYYIMLYTSPWTGFELTTLVVIGADYTGRCKSNYHMITTKTIRTFVYKADQATKEEYWNYYIPSASDWSVTCGMFSPSIPVSSTNKTDRHGITEMLLKVALNTKTQTFSASGFIRLSEGR